MGSDRLARRHRLGLVRAGTAVMTLALVTLSSVAHGAPPARGGAHETGETRTITLPQAIGSALSQNHQLAAAHAGYRASAWAHRQAKAQLLPSISLESSYTRLDDETVARANAFGREITMYFPDSTGTLQPYTIEIPQTVFRDGYQTSLTAQVLLFNPAVLNGVGLAGSARALAAGQMHAAVRSTVHQTVRAYIEVLKMQALHSLQEEHADQASRNLAQAERLAAVGRYGEAEVLRWRVEEAQQRSLLAETARGLRLAALALENLTGATLSGQTRADSALPPALLGSIGHFRALDAEGWQQFELRSPEEIILANPELEVLRATQSLAKREHWQSVASFLPSLSIAVSYGWQNNDTPRLDGDRAWAVTAAVSVPVFTSLSNYSRYQSTRAKLSQTKETLRDARRGLALAAEAARTAIHTAAARLTLAEVARASALRGFQIQQNQFALGRLGNLEWIDANLALRAAEQSYRTSYYDLILAIADYSHATGEILSLVEE